MNRPDPETLRLRRQTVAALDELKAEGLLDYCLIPPALDGPEPHLEVWTLNSRTMWPAPADLSELAQAMWEDLRHRRAVPWSGLLKRNAGQ